MALLSPQLLDYPICFVLQYICDSNFIFHKSILTGHKCTFFCIIKIFCEIEFVGVATGKQRHFASVACLRAALFLFFKII